MLRTTAGGQAPKSFAHFFLNREFWEFWEFWVGVTASAFEKQGAMDPAQLRALAHQVLPPNLVPVIPSLDQATLTDLLRIHMAKRAGSAPLPAPPAAPKPTAETVTNEV